MLLVDIPRHCAFDNAIALLRYDFVYVDFIRSMSRLYTYQGRNHDAVWDIIDSVAHIPQAPNWPSVDFDRTFWAMTLGVPLTGHFQCQFHSVAQRNLYDNHSTIKTPEVCEAVQKKFIKEEDLSYNVVSHIGSGGSFHCYSSTLSHLSSQNTMVTWDASVLMVPTSCMLPTTAHPTARSLTQAHRVVWTRTQPSLMAQLSSNSSHGYTMCISIGCMMISLCCQTTSPQLSTSYSTTLR